MNVLWFLKRRTAFARQLYAVSSAPYVERKRRIEAKEEPYVPEPSDDPEPAFFVEWQEADDSLHVLAYSCISILAASLQAYFKAWERESGYKVPKPPPPPFGDRGWLIGYLEHFSSRIGIDRQSCPADLELLEEVVLARNRIQHVDSITQLRPNFSPSDLKKLKSPLFVAEWERELFEGDKPYENNWIALPTLDIPSEKLMQAIAEMEKLVEWFEEEACRKLFAH